MLAAEPLSHFAISTPNAEIGSADALADAFRFTFFHWGFHAWAVLCPGGIVSWLILAFVNGEKYQLSVVFKPLFGKYAGRTNSNHYRYHHHYCDSDWGSAQRSASVPHKSMVVSPMSLVFLIIVLCKSSLSSLLSNSLSYFCLIRFRKGC